MMRGLRVPVWIFVRKEIGRKRDAMLYSAHTLQGKFDDCRFKRFVRVTRVLFRHRETLSFFDALVAPLFTQMERSQPDDEFIKHTLSALDNKAVLLQDIKRLTHRMYTHGVRASYKKDIDELVAYGQQFLDSSGIAYYHHEIKRISADACHATDEGETLVKDQAALDKILRKAESNKYRIRSMAYALLHEYGVNPVYPDDCQGQMMCDYDGNKYRTIQLGNQCWMAENLRVRHFQQGDPIPYARHAEAVAEHKQRPVCVDYMFERRHASAYGLYYNKQVIRDKRGLAPKGWRVPTPEDIKTLRAHFALYQSALVLGPEIYCVGEPGEEKPGMNLSGFASGQTGYYHPGGIDNSKWSYGNLSFDVSPGTAFYWVEDVEANRVLQLSEDNFQEDFVTDEACCSVRLVRDV
jgi:uncharacterized protein (TIGR02145 family)